MRFSILAFLLTALLAAPLAGASGELDAGLLVARVQDNHGDDCAPQVAPACFVSVTNQREPGDATIDASQRVQYVGVASNVPFLPSVEKNVSGSDLYVQDPSVRQTREAYDTIPQDRPYRDAAGIVLNDEGYGIYYHGPSLAAPTGPDGNRSVGFEYGGTVGYEQFGPYNTPCCTSTESLTHIDGTVCLLADAAACSTYRTQVGDRSRDSAPVIVFGVAWEDVQVATDPERLAGSSALKHKAPIPEGTWRKLSGLPPMGPHPRAHAAPVVLPPPAPSGFHDDPMSRSIWPRPILGNLATFGSNGPDPPGDGALAAVVATVAALLAVLIAFLYSRFHTTDDLLSNETRVRILQLVRDNPGMPIGKLAESIGLARMTLVHHVQFMEKMKLVQSVVLDRRRCVFPYGAAPKATKVSGRVQRLILEILQASPEGRTRAELREALTNVPKQSRDEGIRKLIGKGLVSETRTDRGSVLLVVKALT